MKLVFFFISRLGIEFKSNIDYLKSVCHSVLERLFVDGVKFTILRIELLLYVGGFKTSSEYGIHRIYNFMSTLLFYYLMMYKITHDHFGFVSFAGCLGLFYDSE